MAGAVQFGADVIPFEKGDGRGLPESRCIPSKALARRRQIGCSRKKAEKFGVTYAAPKVDYAVMDHVQDVIGQIAPHDRLNALKAWASM